MRRMVSRSGAEVGDPAGDFLRRGRRSRTVGEVTRGGDGGGVLLGEAVFRDHAGAAGLGQLGELRGDFGLPGSAPTTSGGRSGSGK